MSLSKELGKLKYDKRLTDWFVSRGHFPKDELKKYLETLPDVGHNVEQFSLGDSSADSFGDGADTEGDSAGED